MTTRASWARRLRHEPDDGFLAALRAPGTHVIRVLPDALTVIGVCRDAKIGQSLTEAGTRAIAVEGLEVQAATAEHQEVRERPPASGRKLDDAGFAGRAKVQLTGASILRAVVFSTAVGVLPGLCPVRRAAALASIDALRHE